MKKILSIVLSFFCVLSIAQAQSLDAPSPSNAVLDYFDQENIATVLEFLAGGADVEVYAMPDRVLGCACLGDINRDGNLNLLDVGPFTEAVNKGFNDPCADMNQDGEVNLLDVAPFVDELKNGGCNGGS